MIDHYNKVQLHARWNWTLIDLLSVIRLAADTEFFLGDDRTIAVDILADQVVEKATALTYESLKCTGCSVILVIALEVLCKVLDADREERDLAFGAACVILALTILLEDCLFFFS